MKDINEKLKDYQQQAVLYNSRDSLLGQEGKDYSKISEMSKAFKPYSSLWLTADEWYKNEVEWLEGPWEALDAESDERFGEERCRTLSAAIRFFKDNKQKHI